MDLGFAGATVAVDHERGQDLPGCPADVARRGMGSGGQRLRALGGGTNSHHARARHLAMIVSDKTAEVTELLDGHRSAGYRVAMVGTSGGTHEGHLSLVRRARGLSQSARMH